MSGEYLKEPIWGSIFSSSGRHFLGDSCDGWAWLCAELEARKWFLLPTGPLVINASNDHIAADHLGGEDKDGYTLLAAMMLFLEVWRSMFQRYFFFCATLY